MECLPFYSHRTPIISQTHQNKTINNYQDISEFIFPNITLFLPLKHQNCTSNSLPTWILTNDLGFLFLLDFPWVLLLDYLDKNSKTFDLLSLWWRGNLPQLYLRDLQAQSETFLSNDKTGQINNLAGKYIMKISKLKHVQLYMNIFSLKYW